MRLSTAALLTARFPYVTPSGRVPDNCAASGTPTGADRKAPCAHVRDDPGTRDPVTTCEGNYVDGGYTDNSGLATIISIWPSLRQLIVEHNTYAAESGLRKVAPLIIELDNHYQKSAQPDVASGGTAAETVVPPVTAFGGRSAIQTAARAAAYRILPTSCTVTISPALHPGLIAPLGWELSQAARKDLREGLTEPHPADTTGAALRNLLIVERRLSAERRQERALGDHPLADCLPPNPCRSPSDAPAPNDSPDVSPLENARLKKCRKSEQATEELAVQLNKP
jgi:hypothetical protein